MFAFVSILIYFFLFPSPLKVMDSLRRTVSSAKETQIMHKQLLKEYKTDQDAYAAMCSELVAKDKEVCVLILHFGFLVFFFLFFFFVLFYNSNPFFYCFQITKRTMLLESLQHDFDLLKDVYNASNADLTSTQNALRALQDLYQQVGQLK